MSKIKIGEYRLVPKGTKFWSISNQANISLDEDVIVVVKHTCTGNNLVFVEPRQLIFNIHGYIPSLIRRGSDEWSLRYSKTLPYVIPERQF